MLAIDDLVVAYPNSTRPALDHLSMIIEKSTCILGPSGAGKTTLLKSLIGAVPLRRGSIWLEGVGIARRPLTGRRLVAYMPQENLLPRESTLQEYLTELAVLDAYPPTKVNQAVDEILDLVHLSASARQRLKWLSGGMRRRALLAGALLRQTPWLLLDAPTLGLDPDEQASVRALIRNLSRHRRVIMATQFVEDAEALPERIVILRNGRLALETDRDSLIGQADGHVFRRPWPKSDPDGLEARLWAPLAGSKDVHIFAAAPDVDESWEPVLPTAEAGYLWFLNQAEAPMP